MTVEFIKELFNKSLTAVEVEQVGDSDRFDVRIMPESHPTGAYLYSEVYVNGERVTDGGILNEGYETYPENIERLVFVHEPSGAHYWEVYFTEGQTYEGPVIETRQIEP